MPLETNGKTVRHASSSRGFSLMEMALVMIISGFMFSVVAAAYKTQLQSNNQEELYDNAKELQGALLEFLANAGRYPCPSDPTLPPGDPNYGVENCGINDFATTRDANGDGTPDNVLIGSFPLRTMEPFLVSSPVSDSNTIDPWGNKYTYAVTENLTNPLTYNDYWGTIRLVDEYGDSVVSPANTIHAVLISHGKNGRGAYNRSGTLVDPFALLPPGPPPPTGTVSVSEIENANNDGTFLAGLINESNLNYNDDYTFYILNRSSDLWPIVGSNGDPTNTIYYVQNSNPGNVGVGVTDPQEKLDVAGNIRANDLRTVDICDTGGTNCMPVSRLAGSDDEMQCASGQAVTAFADNERKCADAFTTPSSTLACPAGQYLNGFSNKGGVKCLPIP